MIDNNAASNKIGTIKPETVKLVLNPITSITHVREDIDIVGRMRPNKVCVIDKAYDLMNRTYELPFGTILKFEGTGMLENATLVGYNNIIIADKKVFDNIKLKGTWKCPGNVGWWAEGTLDVNNLNDEYIGLQNALDSTFTELVFPIEKFYTSNTLILRVPKKLVLQGTKTRWPLRSGWSINNNSTFIFTDQNIDLLKISVNNGESYNKADTVEIIGGNFDVSLCDNYSHSVIKVLADDNQRIWGLTINTNIIGKYINNNVNTGIGIDLNPVEISITENNRIEIPNDDPDAESQYEIRGNVAYITNVRIDSDISYMGTGIKGIQWGDDKNWLTDLDIAGNIRYCKTAVDTNADCNITASIQAGQYFSEQHNHGALIIIRGGEATASIGSTIYDIYAGKNGYWANRYAVIVEDKKTWDEGTQQWNYSTGGSQVVAFGRFETFLNKSTSFNVSFVKGRIYNHVIKDSYYTGSNYQEKGAIIINNYYNDTSEGINAIHDKLVHVTNAGGIEEWDPEI